MKPTTSDINYALESIEATERPLDHPRSIARRKVQEWHSDAESHHLPVSNVHDDKGAEVLKVDEVLKWEPEHLGRK